MKYFIFALALFLGSVLVLFAPSTVISLSILVHVIIELSHLVRAPITYLKYLAMPYTFLALYALGILLSSFLFDAMLLIPSAVGIMLIIGAKFFYHTHVEDFEGKLVEIDVFRPWRTTYAFVASNGETVIKTNQ